MADNLTIAYPQSGMNRDTHPAYLPESAYTFAMNANIESEDGNVNVRSNEHSNLLCCDFGGWKVVGYKNDLSTGATYFFLHNPADGTSKISFMRPCEETDGLTEEQILSAVSGGAELCSGLQTLIEDSPEDPCLNFSPYHPIKTIEIKVEKCGKVIYWTDGVNPIRYVMVDKALEPDDEGDIWYHYHGYKICAPDYDRDAFIAENGCVLACEKLRVFPLLDQPCVEPTQIEYGGSLRSGVYQFSVALCDEFGNEKTNYSVLTNPVAIFDRQYIRVEDGLWGARTNLGIRLTVSNLDRQASHYKIAVVQNTVGYNGETQPALDYFIEGIHPVTEKTVMYYSDLNNQRTTFEHIAMKKAVYNTAEGVASVGNRITMYGLTAEKEWNLQPVVSLMGHFLQWQASVAHEDLYKDGNACSLYAGYMRNEVYPFAISFKTSTGYKTPAFVLVPPPYREAKTEMENIDTDRVYQSINQYAPDCSGIERKYKWQYYNTASQPQDLIIDGVGGENTGECRNPATIGQTLVAQRDFYVISNQTVQFSFNADYMLDETLSYFSQHIMDIACETVEQDPSNAVAAEICDMLHDYDEAGTDELKQEIDGVEPPVFPGGCSTPHRQSSIISAPTDQIYGFKEEYDYKELEDMDHVSTDYLYTTGGEKQDKFSVLFDWSMQEQLTEFMDKQFFDDNAGDYSGDGAQHLCSKYDPYFQPANLLKVISDAIYVLDSMPCTCGCFIEEPCENPTVSRSDYNSFQSSTVLLGSYVLDNDVWNTEGEQNGLESWVIYYTGALRSDWRAGRSSSTVHNDAYRSKIAPGFLLTITWPTVEQTVTEDYCYDYLDTGFETPGDFGDGWVWTSYTNLADNSGIGALIPQDWDGSAMFSSEYVVWRFQRYITRNARFIHITKPAEWDDPEYPQKDKVLYLEALGKLDGTMDAVSTQYVRIAVWNSLDSRFTGTSDERKFDITELNFDWAGESEYNGYNFVVVNVAQPFFGYIDEAFFNRHPDGFYVTIDSPIIACPWLLTFRQVRYCKDNNGEEEEDKQPSKGICGTSYVLGKTIYPYIFGIREKEVDRINVRMTGLTLRATVEYAAQCETCGDKPINCAPRPYKFGDFAYWESSEKYPANFELYDSKRMKFASHSYSDEGKSKAYSEIVSKLTEYYGSPVSDGDGTSHFEGHTYGTVETSTTFCQQPIRHYKFPDNQHMRFMNSDARSYDAPSEIYPIGVLLDEDKISVFLDFAVDSKLITKEQRDQIVGYELYRGDRRLNRSVLATGMAFDMFKYDGLNQNINLYPNYPYNDLNDDQYNYKSASRTTFISHPFGKRGNVWYSFCSPDFYFNKPETPTEASIEGFIRGMSVGNFAEVEDHPKWTILGQQSYKMASTLANLESIATVAATIAEELMNRSTSAYVGLVGNLSVAMLFSSMILTISQTLAQRPVLYGKYRYDWLTTFINNGPRRNFAYYYTSIGFYNSMMGFDTDQQYEENRLRGISTFKEIKSGIYPITDDSTASSYVTEGVDAEEGDNASNASGDILYVNNIDRESSVFLSFGNPGDRPEGSQGFQAKYLVEYPVQAQTYDSSRISDPVYFSSGTVNQDDTFERTKMMSYVCSPYMKLMRYRPDQYGQIEDIKWVSIAGCGELTGGKKLVFGGDTYISRFSLKRKFPFFFNNQFGQGDMIPFPYNDYRNVGYPKYYCNYDTGDDMLEITDNERFNSWTSSNKGNYTFYPNRLSIYSLNGENSAAKYVNGRFYLFAYGIPQFLVESEINCNFRLEGPTPREWFYPSVGDFVWWTQEKNVSIREDNDYKISPIYFSRMTLTPNTLPSTYERKFYDCAYQRPNGVIWSIADVSENSQTDPWLSFRPLDYHEFPAKNGKLIHMKAIESEQMLVRFEDQVSLYNAIDVIQERVAGATEMGTGGLFATRPLDYNTTDLGYSGTQSTEIISTEFGHFWVDAKRAQCFMTDPNGRNLEEVSTGIRHWLREHLPFKILRYGIINTETGDEITYSDVDNKFIGLGLSLGWDNRYKRIFITKRDYIPSRDAAGYKFTEGRFYYGGAEVSLQDASYFEDVSFTIAYSCIKGEWISYYSFKPDYYIEQQNHFQTGVNYPLPGQKEGLWSHLLTNKSFQTFYGTEYPFILEVPLKEKFTGSILSSVEYELDARKYVDNVNYTLDRKVGLDSIILYNDTNNSGELVLVPEEKNNLLQKLMYPRVVDGHTEILDTEVYRRHKLNDFFNRVDDDRSDEPVWDKDPNDIGKELRPAALTYSQRWLDRLRGSWMLMRLKKVITDRKILFHWIIGEEKLKNR